MTPVALAGLAKGLIGGGGGGGKTEVTQSTTVMAAPVSQSVNVGGAGFGGVPMQSAAQPASFNMPGGGWFQNESSSSLFGNNSLMVGVLTLVIGGLVLFKLKGKI